MLVLIVSVVIVILCFFDNFALQSNNKPSNSPSTPSNTNITTITTSTTTGTTTTSQVSQILTTLKNKSHAFRWNHCGQTYYNPSLNPHHIEKRIIGGEDAVEHSWPFLVSVRIKLNKSEHQCGGSLITDQHILTAGHCIFPYFHLVSKLKMKISEIFSLIEVHVGINEHEKDPNHLTKEQVYMVEYFDFHENFNFTDPWILVHDIAIIKLKRKVNLNRPEVNVVCLPSATTSQHLKEPRVGENVVAIGWGSYAEEFNYTAYVLNTLQQAMFTVIDQNGEKCNSGMIGNRWDRNFTVCATGYEKKQVTCFGDSGGPVMAYRNNRWTLIGIISFAHDVKDYQANKKKCNASMPFYFVNVAAYIDWVNKKTGFILGKFQS
jgi:secreted trypsin-like serine protease